MTSLEEDALEALRGRVRGEVLRPADHGYDDARTVWNATIDREPTAIVRCRGAADVAAAIEFARERDLPLSVKGGGHHVAGLAVRDDALTIDLGPMDGVRVDPATETVHVQAGATVGDVDRETQAFGLATPLGQDPNIGIGGMTLGGGYGWLSRKYGLTIDNLVEADVVTAEGELVAASEEHNPDLFWALRGGGGNFGVVTSFEIELHEVGPECFGGSLIHPIEDAVDVARRFREFAPDAPREVGLLLDFRDCPPSPAFPAELHGQPVAMIVAFHGGPPEEGAAALAPLREFGDPIVDTLGPRSYLAMQRAGESQGEMRTYVRGQSLERLPDDAIRAMAEAARNDLPGETSVFLAHMGAAMADSAVDATAYPHREPGFYVLPEARWTDPAQDDEHERWVRAVDEAIRPHATGAAVANFLAEDEREERARAAYGENLERLVKVKREWDPENVFDSNVNVDPDWDV